MDLNLLSLVTLVPAPWCLSAVCFMKEGITFTEGLTQMTWFFGSTLI